MMGRIRLDRRTLDALMADLVGRDRSPSSLLVYLALWARSPEGRPATVRASLRDLAGQTGLSKSSVQAAIRNLARRRLVAAAHASPTAVPAYTLRRPGRGNSGVSAARLPAPRKRRSGRPGT